MAEEIGNDLLDYEVMNEDEGIADDAAPQNGVEDVGEVEEAPAYTGNAGVHGIGFKDFLLKPELLRAVHDAGFENPSRVQQECIPHAKMGQDILCQAKSGMGKTAVFVISSLHMLEPTDVRQPSIICLAPTRELAYQISKQYQRFKTGMAGVRIGLFFGGIPFEKDKEKLENNIVHVVVGTPGRLLALVNSKVLDVSHIKTFIVDEVDKMLTPDMREVWQKIFMKAPDNKQVMMFSATISREVARTCMNFLTNPFKSIVDEDRDLILESLHQHYKQALELEKMNTLKNLLDILEFNQMIIFCNTVTRTQLLGRQLAQENFPVIMIHSSMPQEERLARYQQFKTYAKRILVATDLFGRGMDIERVNVVINFDCPRETDTYLHRIARAGRFGTKGLALTFIANEVDARSINSVQDRFDISIEELPDELDPSIYAERDSGHNSPKREEP